ncbi:hypothetical protein QT972_09870 [Microcoleus sp. herbarium7]|uniref:hypothetical protein n=1 Tax=Microcoleus sp. herbarium7 TaxID=3055435 RepID=UPI002FD4A043
MSIARKAFVLLRLARLTPGYTALTGKLRESEALDLDGVISVLKSIYLAACHTVIENTERSEENTGDRKYWENVPVPNPIAQSTPGKITHFSVEDVRKNSDTAIWLSDPSNKPTAPSDLLDITMDDYVKPLIECVRKEVNSRGTVQ